MTLFFRLQLLALILFLAAGSAPAQWRRLGNAAIDLQLSGVATGPMDRVLFTLDGARLFARSAAGAWFSTSDFENWNVEAAAPLVSAPFIPTPDQLPEPAAVIRGAFQRGVIYASGQHVWRSEDEGRTWTNLTQWGQQSILGAPAVDLAVSPRDSEDITVAAGTGIWRSADGGRSWSSCNSALPHLPVRRILSLPRGTAGTRVSFLSGQPQLTSVFEWQPGEQLAWRAVDGVEADEQVRVFAGRFAAPVSIVGSRGRYIYAGSTDGSIWVSMNGGTDWVTSSSYPGMAVEAIHVDAADPRRAVVALSRRAGEASGPIVLRTFNGGMFWDDATGNLPEPAAFGVTADFSSGALYVATLGGIYEADLNAPSWTRLTTDLPGSAVLDVQLDPAGNQLYAAIYGYGVYTSIAPHRRRDLRVVHTADYGVRPAAPGALLTILGARLEDIRAGGQKAAILPSHETETHLQLPYALSGPGVELSFLNASHRVILSMPLLPASPAIFVDPDGSPLALDAESGVLIDTNNPARGGSSIQVFVSGLGRVNPEWPIGSPAPLENQPRVVTPVKATMDGMPLEVVRATLAPGYIGFYLVEVKLPVFVNRGPAEFAIEAGNIMSNRVRLHIEP